MDPAASARAALGGIKEAVKVGREIKETANSTENLTMSSIVREWKPEGKYSGYWLPPPSYMACLNSWD